MGTGCKTIGVGYELKQATARQDITAIGADYDNVLAGAWLTEAQVWALFNVSLARAVDVAKGTVSNYGTLCCEVQNAVTDAPPGVLSCACSVTHTLTYRYAIVQSCSHRGHSVWRHRSCIMKTDLILREVYCTKEFTT